MPALGHRIVVFGGINVDLVIAVDHRPVSGETVRGGELGIYPGGKGANQAAAAARLGGDVHLVGCVGSDAFGDVALAALSDAGVETHAVRRTTGYTGIAQILVTPDGDNSIVTAPGANWQVGDADLASLAQLLTPESVLVVLPELGADLAQRAVTLATSAGARVLMTLSPPDLLSHEAMAACDPLIVNEHEAAHVLGIAAEDVDDTSAAALCDLGPRSVIITLGPRGAIVHDGTGPLHVPAPTVTAVDTTGAGDAFTGALAQQLALGNPLSDAAHFAVRVGATAVMTAGAQPSFPTPDQVVPADAECE